MVMPKYIIHLNLYEDHKTRGWEYDLHHFHKGYPDLAGFIPSSIPSRLVPHLAVMIAKRIYPDRVVRTGIVDINQWYYSEPRIQWQVNLAQADDVRNWWRPGDDNYLKKLVTPKFSAPSRVLPFKT
jgi:hypothetical protein